MPTVQEIKDNIRDEVDAFDDQDAMSKVDFYWDLYAAEPIEPRRLLTIIGVLGVVQSRLRRLVDTTSGLDRAANRQQFLNVSELIKNKTEQLKMARPSRGYGKSGISRATSTLPGVEG